MKELELVEELLGLARGSARDAREKRVAELVADVRVDEDPADAAAAVGEGAADLRGVVGVVDHERAPASEDFQLVYHERAVGFHHLLEIL